MDRVHIGQLSDFAPDEARVVTVDRPDGGAEQVIVARNGDEAAAFADLCPHIGASLQTPDGRVLRKRDHIFCARHSATFDARTGVCVWGPCEGRSLTPLKLEIEGGELWLS